MMPKLHCTKTAQKQIHENGFYVYKNALPKEKVLTAAEFAEYTYIEEHLEAIKNGMLPEEFTLKNPFPKNSKEKIIKEMAQKSALDMPTLQGSMSASAKLSNCFLDLYREKIIIEFFSEILESQNVYLHLPPWLRVIHPNFEFSHVPPHNDISYFQNFKFRNANKTSSSELFYSIWMPLKAIWGIDGGLAIYENQKTSKVLQTPQMLKSKTEFWIASMAPAKIEPTVPKYEIGDFIVFGPEVVHGSAKVSDKATDFRISMDERIFGDGTLTSRFYMNLNTGERFEPGSGPCGFSV